MTRRQRGRMEQAIAECLMRGQLPFFFVSDGALREWRLDVERLGSWWWEELEAGAEVEAPENECVELAGELGEEPQMVVADDDGNYSEFSSDFFDELKRFAEAILREFDQAQFCEEREFFVALKALAEGILVRLAAVESEPTETPEDDNDSAWQLLDELVEEQLRLLAEEDEEK